MTDEKDTTPVDADPEGDVPVETFDAGDPTRSTDEFRGARVVAWQDGAPVRADDVADRDKSEVVTAGADLLGAPSPSGDQGAPRVYTDAEAAAQAESDTAEVPTTASDVVAWIKAGEDQSDDEAQRRAGLAWTAESQRDGGVRSTVEAEVDRWLTPASS